MLSIEQKQAIAQKIRKELPNCEFSETRNTIKINVYHVDDLINLVYDIHERGVKQGRENAKRNLKSLLVSTIHNY